MAFVPSVSIATRPVFNGASVTPTTATPTAVKSTTPRTAGIRMSAAASDVPDLAKRRTMNVLLYGTVTTLSVGMLYPVGYFFVPRGSGGAGAGTQAKDALGNSLKKEEYLKSHFGGSRELVQGLRGDATYLIVNDDKTDLEYFALNAVCTHLGCVVPWVKAENKFKCPCHGSQYAPDGAVVRGPAPLPLALEHVEVDENDNIILKSWKETDFRTNDEPWWNF